MTSKKYNRRQFLKNSSLISAGSIMTPLFLSPFSHAHQPLTSSQKKLIIIQLSGGNDGLNTLIPFRNDLYYKARPHIGIEKNNCIPIHDAYGLNPEMKGMEAIFKEGDALIINGVGYPDPDLSHFRSTDIWQTASRSDQFLSTGWIGRFLDQNSQSNHTALEMDDTLSLALKGHNNRGFATSNPQMMKRSLTNPLIQHSLTHHHDHDHNENISYLYKTLIQTHQSADYLFEKANVDTQMSSFPNTKFAKNLKQVAQFIISGSNTQIYFVELTGFDTHFNQQARQGKLLKTYSDGVHALRKELRKHGLWNDTLVFTYSEFGRRISENGSKGTDHGTANLSFILGGNLHKKGIYNDIPSLKTRDNNLTHSIDFRQIYATLLDKWLEADTNKIIDGSFDQLDFL